MSVQTLVLRPWRFEPVNGQYFHEQEAPAPTAPIRAEECHSNHLKQATLIAGLGSATGTVIGVLASMATWSSTSGYIGLLVVPQILTNALIVGAWLGSLLWNPDS